MNLRSPEDASLLGRKMVLFTVWLFLCPRLRMRRWMCWCQADEAEGQSEEDGWERLMTGKATMLCCDQYEHRSIYVSNAPVLCSCKSSLSAARTVCRLVIRAGVRMQWMRMMWSLEGDSGVCRLGGTCWRWRHSRM